MSKIHPISCLLFQLLFLLFVACSPSSPHHLPSILILAGIPLTTREERVRRISTYFSGMVGWCCSYGWARWAVTCLPSWEGLAYLIGLVLWLRPDMSIDEEFEGWVTVEIGGGLWISIQRIQVFIFFSLSIVKIQVSFRKMVPVKVGMSSSPTISNSFRTRCNLLPVFDQHQLISFCK